MKRLNRLARARPAQARAPTEPAAETTLVVTEMGAKGEGVAQGPSGLVYAPFALPGERIRARVIGERADLIAVEEASPDRRAPPCALFGKCGGCQTQHWADAPYLAWKEDQVRKALARRGVEAEIAPLAPAWGEGRRRASFHASRTQGRLAFGFVARGGAQIADLDACPVLAPGLAEALPALRKLAAIFAPARGEANVHCLLTETGVDCDIKGAAQPDRGMLERAAEAARPLARLSLDGAPLVVRTAPVLEMGDVRVTPPPGAFAQPTRAGEELLAKHALAAIDGAKNVIDLFSGIGTFALRAGARTPTHAVDSDMTMLAALKDGADRAGLHGVTIARRDLLRTPMAALELKKYDAVMFDPPRSGARLQAAEIAKSKAARVAAISCDASTFARDARLLIDGGFKLVRVSPVDQFRWTPHVELVGAFVR